MEDSTVTGKNLHLDGKIITINEGEVKGYLDAVVKETVEETLNGLLDAEADELCRASKYERSKREAEHTLGSLYKDAACGSRRIETEDAAAAQHSV